MRAPHSLGAVTLTAMLLTGCGTPAPFHATVISDPLPASPLQVHDSRGGLFDLAAGKGHTVLVFFGYTHCPDVCPTTLADFARARRMLKPREQQAMQFVFVSVDPERDTPAKTEEYARQFDSSFVGLAPTQPELENIGKAWGFAVFRDSIPGNSSSAYGVSHPAGVFLVDREGRVRMVFGPGTVAADIAADLKRLL